MKRVSRRIADPVLPTTHARIPIVSSIALPDKEPGRHAIKLDTNSQLGRAIGKSDVSVNHYHKQAVLKIGRGCA